MLLSHRIKDITMCAKMLKVLENITKIMLSRILAEFFSADFWRRVHFRRIWQILGGLGSKRN